MNKKGFTVVELLVVVAIIGVLATLSIVGVKRAKAKTNDAKASSDISELYKAICNLANDTYLWPGKQNVNMLNLGVNNEICGDGCAYGLSDSQAGLITTDGNYPGWAMAYMSFIPLDPWGNEYFFDTDYRIRANGEPCAGDVACIDVVVLGSYGPDGLGNNQYSADDIIKVIVR